MMPWTNQSGGGGGWKGSGGGPWGQPPRNQGSGPNPPDLEELLRRSQDKLKRVLPGGGGRGVSPVAIIAILAIAAALLAYNFFTFRVQPDEVGVVLRFGKFNREAVPGLNFRLPYPIESVYTPKVTRVNRLTVGQVQDETGSATGRDIPEESLMLTGDENIVDIDFSVFWVIKDASSYLFNMEDPEGTVKAVAESAMREVVGASQITPLLTQARQKTEQAVQQLIQETLDEFAAGIQITQVQLLKVDPPDEVIASFRDVQAASADAERLQNEARTYANKVLPEAQGQAAQITASAKAYADRITAEAQGQADRFTKVYESYKLSPDIVRKRMYLETMEQVLGDMDKVILDERGTGPGVIPYLPLQSLTGRPPTASPSTPSSGSGSGQ
jgi:membrane protease subunit HflK